MPKKPFYRCWIVGLTPENTQEIDQIASLAAQFNKLFVVTLGAGGSLAFHGSSRNQCAAVSVDRVIDTTGAGDAYAAAFLAGYCHGYAVSESMQRGAEVAAAVVTQQGSYPAYDDAKEE